MAYAIDGDLARLRIPPMGPVRMGARLWEHTCCEIFIGRMDTPGYYEFNFAPSGEWAAHAFRAYRGGTTLVDEALAPQVAVRRGRNMLELDALVRLDCLPPGYAATKLRVALAAVIEDGNGALSYWALRHPPGKPDFHHPEGFALELDEARN